MYIEHRAPEAVPPRQQRIPRRLAAGARTPNGATIVAPRARESRSASRLRPTLKILVTGASGFTGSHLARQAIEAGYAVRALVRASSCLKLLEDAPVELVEGDLRDPASLRRAVAGVDRVFHVAAAYREARLSDDIYREVNVDGTRRLAEACLSEGGVPLIHCSTCGVHGEVLQPPADETAPYRPDDVYQETKAEAERVLLSLNRERGLLVVILRPVGIYGPGDRRFLKLFRGIARRRFPLIGKGDVLYHMTHVRDVARGFLRASERLRGASGEAFILAGPRYTTVRELVELVAREADVPPPRLRIPAAPAQWAAASCESLSRRLGVEPPLHRRRLDFFLTDRAFRTEKASRVLDWRPQVDLPEGIRETLGWYRAHGWM